MDNQNQVCSKSRSEGLTAVSARVFRIRFVKTSSTSTNVQAMLSMSRLELGLRVCVAVSRFYLMCFLMSPQIAHNTELTSTAIEITDERLFTCMWIHVCLKWTGSAETFIADFASVILRYIWMGFVNILTYGRHSCFACNSWSMWKGFCQFTVKWRSGI